MDTVCLREAYQSRIELLAKHPLVLDTPQQPMKFDTDSDGFSDQRTINFIRDPKDNMADFSKVLIKKGQSGKIIGCDKVILMATGLNGQVDGNTFAGICTAKNQKKRFLIQICYTPFTDMDNTMDNFDIQIINQADASYEKLTNFAINKCL
jgi:hypothetical protein